MTNKKKFFFIFILIVIVAVIVAVMSIKQKNNLIALNKVAEENNSFATEAETLENARVAVPGTSLISKEDIVITPEGKPVSNTGIAGTPAAPQQSEPVLEKDLSPRVIKIDVSSKGFSPKEFSVIAGAVVTLAVSSKEDATHVFMFDDPSLSAVVVGVRAQETRAISFNAPQKAGEYTFHCDVPGHVLREVGKMIVR